MNKAQLLTNIRIKDWNKLF